MERFIAQEIPAEDDIYEAVACLACPRVHLVNPANGKVLGGDDE